MNHERITIIGGGNLGSAIAHGLTATARRPRSEMVITRRTESSLEGLRSAGFSTSTDNRSAIREAGLVIIAVRPAQLTAVLDEVAGVLDPTSQVVVSTVTNVSIAEISRHLPESTHVLRAHAEHRRRGRRIHDLPHLCRRHPPDRP